VETIRESSHFGPFRGIQVAYLRQGAKRDDTRQLTAASEREASVERIGVSFRSSLSPDKVRMKFIEPLRTALRQSEQGIDSNHLRQVDPKSADTEHLLVFEVNDFKEGLRILRVELEKIGPPEGLQLHNLNPSHPGY
jgi:hypothetical protein